MCNDHRHVDSTKGQFRVGAPHNCGPTSSIGDRLTGQPMSSLGSSLGLKAIAYLERTRPCRLPSAPLTELAFLTVGVGSNAYLPLNTR